MFVHGGLGGCRLGSHEHAPIPFFAYPDLPFPGFHHFPLAGIGGIKNARYLGACKIRTLPGGRDGWEYGTYFGKIRKSWAESTVLLV